MSLILVCLLGLKTPANPWGAIATADSAHVQETTPAVVGEWEARLEEVATDWPAHLGLGTVALLSYNGDRALEHFMRLADEAPEPWGTFGLSGAALTWSGRGSLRVADSIFSLAVGRAMSLADERLRAELSIHLARVQLRTRGPAVGLALLDSIALSPPDDLRLEASLLCSRSEATMLTGGTALEDADRGITAATRIAARSQCVLPTSV